MKYYYIMLVKTFFALMPTDYRRKSDNKQRKSRYVVPFACKIAAAQYTCAKTMQKEPRFL